PIDEDQGGARGIPAPAGRSDRPWSGDRVTGAGFVVSATGRRRAPSSAPALARGAAPPLLPFPAAPTRGSGSRAPPQIPAPASTLPDSFAPRRRLFPDGPAPLPDSPIPWRTPDRSAPPPGTAPPPAPHGLVATANYRDCSARARISAP